MSDLFDESATDDNQVTVDPDKNYLEELVGDSRKFKTPEELARGKYEADLFIEQLKREQRELRDELNKRLSLEEFADQFSKKTLNKPPSSSPSNTSEQEDDEGQVNLQSPRTPEDIEKFLEQKLTEREKRTKSEQNLQSVYSEMERRYGSAANKAIQERAKELGVGVQFLRNIAETSPKSFLELFPQKRHDDTAPPSSEIRRPATDGQSGTKKFKDYEKMRKENPREYFKPHIQMEMFEQARKLGADFYT